MTLLLQCVTVAVLILLWGTFVTVSPSMWVAAPWAVADRLAEWSLNGMFGLNGAVTVGETVIGLGLGTAGALVFGLALGYYGWLRRSMYPIALLCYSVPLAALAPPFTAVLGVGLASKVALTSITAFFLLFFSVLSGAAALNKRLTAVLQVMGASDREILLKLYLPASKDWIITGLRTAAPFSLLTAITAEIWGSRMGLGFLVTRAVETNDITGMYAVLIVLAIVGVALNMLVGELKHFGGGSHAV